MNFDFVISKDKIARNLSTPFALCIGKKDLEHLIRELQKVLGGMDEVSYEWVRIDPSHPSDAPANTVPLEWTDTGPMVPGNALR